MDSPRVQHAGRAAATHDRELPEVDLFCPLELRGVRLKNRIAMSPMCQYSSLNGLANDWHLVHLGSRAQGEVALVIAEATAVTPEGRISPADLGLWNDGQIEPLARITRFVREQGAIPGIQLAHAGRKGSSEVPWKGRGTLKTPAQGGWEVLAPSPIPFNAGDPTPRALDEPGIEEVIRSFEAATRRALQAGFSVIEIHAAHGYLLHQFLSPLSNHRTDAYGGPLENRMRLLLRVTERLRQIVPDEFPLFVRISATDWVEGGWDLQSSIELAKRLRKLGVDLLDVSSGGSVPTAKIPVAKGYQVPFAKSIRENAGIRTGAVGMITDAEYANEVITSGSANLILVGRELLREPYWGLKAQCALDVEASWPVQYGYAVKRHAG